MPKHTNRFLYALEFFFFIKLLLTLSQNSKQVHISEARVSTALQKLAHMEELVNDRLLPVRVATESDKPSYSTSVQDLDREKTNIGGKSLNVSGPVQPYSPHLKNFWYPVAFTADLKHDTMVCTKMFFL